MVPPISYICISINPYILTHLAKKLYEKLFEIFYSYFDKWQVLKTAPISLEVKKTP